MRKIGLIGLGLIGSNICAHLCKSYVNLAVFDCDKEKRDRFFGEALICENAGEVLNNSEVILLSLPNSEVVEAVMDELLSLDMQDKVIIDLSTSFPLSTKALYKSCQAKGSEFIDCPLLAGPDEAAKGELIAVVGGGKAIIDQLDDVFLSFCKSYDYVGESGNAHTMKIMMNFTGLMYVIILGQMFPLAEKVGLDPMELYHVMDNEVFSTWMYRFYGPKMINRTFDKAFDLKLGLKDLTYMKKLYDYYNVPAFTLDGAIDLLRIATKDGKGDFDFSRCAQTMQEFPKLPSEGEN